MARRRLGSFLSVLVLSLHSSTGCVTKGERILEIPSGLVGIVAYGSLISLPSLEQTLGHPYNGPIHEVHLEGYERMWTCVRPFNDPQAIAAGAPRMDVYFLRDGERVPINGTAELNIYPKKKSRINGILYLIADEELLSLDKREHGYRRVDVTDRIEEFRFRGGKVYVYEGLPGTPVATSADKGTYVLIKEFSDLVTGACDLRGKEFREEFDKSTRLCGYPVLSYRDIVWVQIKQLLFVSKRDGNADLYLMNADGTGHRALTANSEHNYSAAWSPDGSRIAFTSRRDGHHEVYVMKPDGTGQTRLTATAANSFGPVWSPDNAKIAFHSDRDGNQEIYVMNADGAGQIRLTHEQGLDAAPSWSPDGRLIVFVRGQEGQGTISERLEIWIMGSDGSDQARLTNNTAFEGWPAWSPDGGLIAFETERDGNFEIYVMKPDGSKQTRLTHSAEEDRGPSWSPDGRKILFERGRPRDIYVMNADGTGETRLTADPAWDFVPQWSPDGSLIAFVRVIPGPGDSPHGGDEEIFVMNADGSGVKRLTHSLGVDYAPLWRPVR